MPTYAYVCTQCGHHFDAVQSFSDAALTECPECGGTLRKQYGSIGVTFHGSGFYHNDSRASSAAGAGASSGEKPAAAPKSEAGASTSSAAKTS